jgi:hypothetical protein
MSSEWIKESLLKMKPLRGPLLYGDQGTKDLRYQDHAGIASAAFENRRARMP